MEEHIAPFCSLCWWFVTFITDKFYLTSVCILELNFTVLGPNLCPVLEVVKVRLDRALSNLV